MTGQQTREFVHPTLGEEVAAIGGRYVFMKEGRLSLGGREVIYHVGAAAADSSCCGGGGVAFAAVAGFVCDPRPRCGPGGRRISRVAPIVDAGERRALARLIREREGVHQVNFL